MTFVPAAPNTYIIERNNTASEGFVREPIIGYYWDPEIDQETQPITIDGRRRVVSGAAILFPCGMVVDPVKGHSFSDTEEWLQFVPSDVRSENTIKPFGNKLNRAEGEGSETPDGYDIEWTNKSFKNQSFWHYDDGTHEFCFILPGEEDAPKQTDVVKKIKRVDMDKLKKRIDVLDIEDVKNPDILPDADPEEDEDEDDDEDDGGLL